MKKLMTVGAIMAVSPLVIGSAMMLLNLLHLGLNYDLGTGFALLELMGLIAIVGFVLFLVGALITFIDSIKHRGENKGTQIARPMSITEKAVGIAVVLIILSLCFRYFSIH